MRGALSLCLATLSLAVWAGGGRISVLDFGAQAGVSTGLGCASSPSAFVRALGGAYDVRVVSYDGTKAARAFDRAETDLLIVPTGALFPADCAAALVSFLKRGGLLLTCGGYAFDEPMYRENGTWVASRHREIQMPPCPTPLVLPAASVWRADCSRGSTMRIRDVSTPDGKPGLCVETPRLMAYNLASVEFPKDVPAFGAIAFSACGGEGSNLLRIEANERDGTRWYAQVAVTTVWRRVTLTWNDFTFHGDSPTKGRRGGVTDRIDFSSLVRLVVCISRHGNELGRPHAFSVGDFSCGDDPQASVRERKLERVRINHHHYGAGWTDQPRPDQLGLFSPAYRFTGVSAIRTDPSAEGRIPHLELNGRFSGYDAQAMLTPRIHAHAPNRAVLRPVLSCFDSAGAPKGHAASLVFHYDDVFKGSAWALFGVDSDDLFATPACDGLLREMVDALFRRAFLCETRPSFACYRPGETARISTCVRNFGSRPLEARVTLRIRDEAGMPRRQETRQVTVAAGGAENVSVDWPVPADGDDYYRIDATLESGGHARDVESSALTVWREKTVRGGPRLTRDGAYFAIDGRTAFWTGAQMFLARQAPYTSSSARRFYEDFSAMRRAGIRLSRNFFGWDHRAVRKDRDARERVLRTMDACVLLSQKFGIVNYFNPVCGNSIPQTLAELGQEAEDIAFFAQRYRDVPGFLMDLRNEPQLNRPQEDGKRLPLSPRALASTFSAWSQALTDAAHGANAALNVSVGWSQGWGGTTTWKDPPTVNVPLDFTDCHYYGGNANQLIEIKKVDRRVFGQPAVMGEFGVAFNPARVPFSDTFATEEEAARRYRCQLVRAFGSGFAFACNYGWTDIVEGNLTCALCHWDNTPRPVVGIYTNLMRTLSRLTPVTHPPEVVLLLPEARLDGDGSSAAAAVERVLSDYARAVDTLSWWGVDYSVVDEGEWTRLPTSVKWAPRPAEVGSREAVGTQLAAHGVTPARQPGDPASLEVYRVRGKGATAWALWNPDKSASAVFKRGDARLTIGPERAGYLEISDSGAAMAAEEL